MILDVISWALLFQGTIVHSAITSAQSCGYASQDSTCSGDVEGECTDLCTANADECAESCDSLAMIQAVRKFKAWGECYTDRYTSLDVKDSCEDDGTGGCEGDGVCVKVCTTNSTTCGGNCWSKPVTTLLGDPTCDDAILQLKFRFPEVESYCECFTHVGELATYDVVISCGGLDTCEEYFGSEGDNTSSSTDTTMIIGIVVGGVVLVVLVIVAVGCIKRKKL